MRSIKKIAAVVTLLAGALVSSASPASAAQYQPNFWDSRCNPGRACIFPATAPGVWNADRCFDNFIPAQSFYYAQADGNPFTVYYQDGRWDYVNAHSVRPLDANNRVTKVVVWC
jgi:hypothetical protein